MNPKFVIAFLFCLIQTNRGENIQENIAELTSQIASVRTNITLVIEDDKRLFASTHKAIGQVITQGESTIQSQLDQLDNILQEAELEAAQKFVDISECTGPVNDWAIDVDIFQKNCSKNHHLDLFGTDLGNLGHLKRDVSNSINVCLGRNPDNVEGLKTCVQSNIEKAQSRTDQIQKEISSVVEDAKKTASTCVESFVTSLDEEISRVAHDLKNCLSNIL